MRTFQLILGVAMLSLGASLLLMRERLPAYHERRNGRAGHPVIVWITLGSVLALAGIGQIILGA